VFEYLASLTCKKVFFVEMHFFLADQTESSCVFTVHGESCELSYEQSAAVASFRRIFEVGLITLQKTKDIHARNLRRKSSEGFNYFYPIRIHKKRLASNTGKRISRGLV